MNDKTMGLSEPKEKKMRLRLSVLVFVCIYAIVAASRVSRRFGLDLGKSLQQKNQYDEEDSYIKSNNVGLSSPTPAAESSLSYNDTHHAVAFPVKTHILTHGKARTATTLLFNMVGASYFLYLVKNDPEQIPDLELIYLKRRDGIKNKTTGRIKPLRKFKTTKITKMHVELDNYLNSDAVVFSTAKSKEEAVEIKRNLTRDGHTVAFVQDMESLKEAGIAGLVDKYVAGYGLSERDRANLNDYFRHWEILRQCCGQQMSVTYRNDLMPDKFKLKTHKRHKDLQVGQSICHTYDIDSIEKAFMHTELFGMIEKYPNSSVRSLNKPSLNDGALNGTYCSSYNHLVRTLGLSIWGVPGGRSDRSPLDRAIKEEIIKGRTNLTESAYSLFPNTDVPIKTQFKEIWAWPKKSKEKWLKAVLAARLDGNKTYADLDFETSEDASDRGSDNLNYFKVRAGHSGDLPDDDDKSENNVDHSVQRGSGATKTGDVYHNTHAIFLISFGEEASESTIVERCILSLRRRGAWGGYIVVLTDAAPERYKTEWDDKVIIMHPLEKDLELADGAPLKFSEENRSLKPKIFKTYVLDYFDREKRLDSIELIYYLDVDIMAGNSIEDLFDGVERKYGISQEERRRGRSKLYFFTPLSKEWPLQAGTFIVERRSSRRCLELWRNEIKDLAVTGRGMDQDALRAVYERTESGEESKCQLIRMDNENFITFPRPREFPKSIYHNLIHISNSVFAKWIGEEKQNEFVHELLQLSEEEKPKYGKVSIKMKASDMHI